MSPTLLPSADVTRTDKTMPDLPKIPMTWRWILATVVTTAIVVILLLVVYYPDIPDPMPAHWNAAGEADAFREKTLGGFLFNILLGPVVLVLSHLAAEAMLSMQSAYVTGPGGAKEPNEAHRTWHGYRATQRHLGWFMFTLNLLVLFMLARNYTGNPNRWELPLSLATIFALCGVFMWELVKEQKTIEKKYPKKPGEQGKAWGIFYNDPEDKRILVDTGTGTNFTFNLGQPAGRAWAFILFILLPGALLVWVAISAFR